MPEKIKLLTLGDHPLIPSGVGTQCKYIFEGLLKTGRYRILSLGGAMKHEDYRPIRLEEYGEDWTIVPVDGYGTQDMIRQILTREKPDALYYMTDPRFYDWLFQMSDEIRDRGVPMLYNHVWDNYPVPKFNAPLLRCNDFIGCISKLTFDICQKLGLGDRSEYIPHGVNTDFFHPHSREERRKNKIQYLGNENSGKFVIFYNSRNARRKMTADVLKNFRSFLNIVGENKAFLFMHTNPFDHEGSNLMAVAEQQGITPSQIKFSPNPVPPEELAKFYNLSDLTINISDAEGFGLSCLESLSCGRLVLVNKTGGLQDQAVDDDGTVYGACIPPATQSIQGSQQIPYIFADRVADKDVVDALVRIFRMDENERYALGLKASAWTKKAFSIENMVTRWDNAVTSQVSRCKAGKTNMRLRVAQL